MSTVIVIRRTETQKDKTDIAELLFEKDKPFVPVTSLSSLDTSETFFVASIEHSREIRACSSYDYWLTGCNDKNDHPKKDISVYELSSTLVRSPLGGFKPPEPSIQKMVTFARIISILGTDLDQQEDQGSFCIIACIMRDNTASYTAMTDMGMIPVDPLPRWLQYEHRTWFPKRNEESERQISQEAHYLWLPGERAKAFFETILPFVEGKLIKREIQDNSKMEEEFSVKFRIRSIERLIEEYGNLTRAAGYFRYDILSPPPKFVRIGDGLF